jgi:hypothetical protein
VSDFKGRTWRISENRLMRIFGPKRGEVIGHWRTVNNQELHNLHSSPILIRVTKLRSMKWAGHVARMGTDACI